MAANLAREMAAVGLPRTARLAGAAAAQRMVFVDAPVSGSEGPVRAGQLTILASGPDWLADLAETTAESLTFAHQLGLNPAVIDIAASYGTA